MPSLLFILLSGNLINSCLLSYLDLIFLQSIHMIHGFCTCESTYLITFICNPEINLMVLLGWFAHMCRVGRFELLGVHVPCSGETEQHCTVLFQLLYNKQISFLVSVATFFTFLCFWWFHCLKWPSSILECCSIFLVPRRLMCLIQKICVLDNLHLGMYCCPWVQCWVSNIY